MSPSDAAEVDQGDTTLDAFLGGAVMVRQPARGYRAGIDAVLLAAAVAAQEGEYVLDAGAGAGVVGLCVAVRVAGARVALVENDAELVRLARQNVVWNELSERVSVHSIDVTRSLPAEVVPELAAGRFHHVVANPPFNIEGRGRAPRNRLKAGSHAMPAGALDRWVRFLARMARADATATIIHRADALGELLGALDGRFGDIRVLPILPRAETPAVRVLVQARKGSRAPLSILPPLVLHGAGNSFLPPVEAILRTGAPLDAFAGG